MFPPPPFLFHCGSCSYISHPDLLMIPHFPSFAPIPPHFPPCSPIPPIFSIFPWLFEDPGTSGFGYLLGLRCLHCHGDRSCARIAPAPPTLHASHPHINKVYTCHSVPRSGIVKHTTSPKNCRCWCLGTREAALGDLASAFTRSPTGNHLHDSCMCFLGSFVLEFSGFHVLITVPCFLASGWKSAMAMGAEGGVFET